MDITVKEISKVYTQGNNKIWALHKVSAEFPESVFAAVKGPSGCGKTTFVRIVGGIDEPYDGQVLYDGTDVFRLNEAKRNEIRLEKIGFVFQEPRLFPTLTAIENIYTPLLIKKQKIDKSHINELCEKLGITHLADRLPKDMSGGERQRVAVARALSVDPEVLITDEPTAHLDHENSEKLMEILLVLHQRLKQTLIVVTHDERIYKKADMIIDLDK